MLITISPSKGQDFKSEYASNIISTPDALNESKKLIKELRKLNSAAIQKLMAVSENIANLNFKRFQHFSTPFTKANAAPALFTFTGDVYSGFSKHEYTDEDLAYSQNHLRILSGLYGALRPMDLIQPYRLEMKTRLKNPRGKDLYQFWGERITEQINQELTTHDNKILLNLASNEYFKAIKPKLLDGKLVQVHFKETKDGKARVVAIFAKRARGLMSDYILRNRVDDLTGVKKFTIANYKFSTEDSDSKNLVFTRKQPQKQ